MHTIQELIFKPNSREIFFIIIFLMILILIDTFLIKFYDLIDKKLIPIIIKKSIFSLIVFVSLFLELVIINYIKNLTINNKSSSKINNKSSSKIDLKLINKLARLSLYILVIVFSFMIFQIFYLDKYDSYLLILIVLISYGTSSIFILKGLNLFIFWFKVNRNFIFFLYSLSISMILFNLIMSSIIVSLGIQDRPYQVRQFAGGTMDIFAGKYNLLIDIFKISAILSFVSIWLTTALIMHMAKDRNIGKVINWMIITLPLGYFLVSYFAQNILSDLLFPFLVSDPVYISIIFTAIFILSKPVGGITFGFLYWRISRLVKFEKLLREYMIIAGYGFLLLFSANQSTSLVLTPFPPFGAMTIVVLIPSTYLIFIGIYKAATTASANADIRKYIYQIARESRLLDLMSRTEIEKEINNTVNKVLKYSRNPAFESTEVELQETELKDYIEQVVNHLKKEKK